MQKYIPYILLFIFFSACKKPAVNLPPAPPPSTFKDLKPLPITEIKSILDGQWKLIYENRVNSLTGDIQKLYYNNSFIVFYAIDSLKWTINTTLIVQDKIKYTRERSAYGGDSLTAMRFYSMVPAIPEYWSPLFIEKDTLVIYELGNAGTNYHLTRK